MNRHITLLTVCPFCNVSHNVNVGAEGWVKHINGASIKDAFPYLDSNERELLMTGICSKCWDETMKGEDDE